MDTSLHYLTMANQMLIQKRLLERVKASGLTLGQPKVLDYLKDHDGASQKEIAAGCLIEAGSLTSILNRMEEKNLIERRMLNGNRRTFHIFMTESGKKARNWLRKFSGKLKRLPGKIFRRKKQKLLWRFIIKFIRTCLRQAVNIQGKREVTNEQTKKICDFSDRAFCELARCQPDHESKSWNIANFIDSICTESQLSVYTWKLYNIFQYISDLAAAFDPAQKLQAGTRITDSGFHHLRIFY